MSGLRGSPHSRCSMTGYGSNGFLEDQDGSPSCDRRPEREAIGSVVKYRHRG